MVQFIRGNKARWNFYTLYLSIYLSIYIIYIIISRSFLFTAFYAKQFEFWYRIQYIHEWNVNHFVHPIYNFLFFFIEFETVTMRWFDQKKIKKGKKRMKMNEKFARHFEVQKYKLGFFRRFEGICTRSQCQLKARGNYILSGFARRGSSRISNIQHVGESYLIVPSKYKTTLCNSSSLWLN